MFQIKPIGTKDYVISLSIIAEKLYVAFNKLDLYNTLTPAAAPLFHTGRRILKKTLPSTVKLHKIAGVAVTWRVEKPLAGNIAILL
jgi:hypothetical protein